MGPAGYPSSNLESMARTAFVTGGTGFLGRHVVEQLTAQGWRVVALHRPTSDVTHLKAYGVELAVGSITDAASLARAMPEGCDAVFHVAGNTSLWSGGDAQQTLENVDGTRFVVETALARKARAASCTRRPRAPWGEQHDVPFDETATSNALASTVNYERTKYLGELEVGEGRRGGASRRASCARATSWDATTPRSGRASSRWSTRASSPASPRARGRGRTPARSPARTSPPSTRAGAASVTCSGACGDLPGDGDRSPDSSRARRCRSKPMPGWVIRALGRVSQWGSYVTKRAPTVTPEIAVGTSRPPHLFKSDKAIRELGLRGGAPRGHDARVVRVAEGRGAGGRMTRRAVRGRGARAAPVAAALAMLTGLMLAGAGGGCSDYGPTAYPDGGNGADGLGVGATCSSSSDCRPGPRLQRGELPAVRVQPLRRDVRHQRRVRDRHGLRSREDVRPGRHRHERRDVLERRRLRGRSALRPRGLSPPSACPREPATSVRRAGRAPTVTGASCARDGACQALPRRVAALRHADVGRRDVRRSAPARRRRTSASRAAPDDGDFYRLPFPNDVRNDGGHIDAHGAPDAGPRAARLRPRRSATSTTSRRTTTGSARTRRCYFRFSAPVDSNGTLKGPGADPAGSTSPSRRAPSSCRSAGSTTTDRNAYICNNWMGIRPPHGASR